MQDTDIPSVLQQRKQDRMFHLMSAAKSEVSDIHFSGKDRIFPKEASEESCIPSGVSSRRNGIPGFQVSFLPRLPEVRLPTPAYRLPDSQQAIHLPMSLSQEMYRDLYLHSLRIFWNPA